MGKNKHFAYLAGLLDGEGNIGVYRSKNTKGYWGYALNICAYNSDIRVMRYLIKHFGGTFHKGERTYVWEPNGGKAKATIIINGVAPNLVVKHEQASVVQEFIGLGNKINPVSRKLLYDRTRYLNAVGVVKRGSMPSNTKQDWAYLAALLDGEGHIRISKAKQSNFNGICYGRGISIRNCSEVLMKYLVKHFDGVYKPRFSKNPKDAPSFVWNIFGNQLQEKLILAVLPYLVSKKEQAKILLEFIRLNGKINPIKREELYQKMCKERYPISSETNTLDGSTIELKIESELHSDMQSASLVTMIA